jgi:hypothetical protein
MVQIRRMAERFGNDKRMADLYRAAYDLAAKRQDDLQALWILRALIDLQNRAKSHPYSPWAEFEAIRRLKAAGDFKAAYKIAESMAAFSMKPSQKARWLYEKALLENRLGKRDAADRSLRDCAAIRNGGDWARLCRDALTYQAK